MRLFPVSLLDRYVLRQLLWGLLASTLALVALMWLVQSLRFVELVVNRGLSLWVFLNLTVLLVPQLVAFVLPVTTFAVVQMVYQRMTGDREITVMQSAGLSRGALARPAILLGIATLLGGLALANWLVPLSYGKFREAQFAIRNRMAVSLLEDGVFTEISQGLTVFVRRRDADGTLHGVLIDDARKPGDQATIFAEHGVIANGATGPRVLLEQGSRQQIDHETGRLDVLSFDQDLIVMGEDGKAEETRARDPDELSMAQLLNAAAAGGNGVPAAKFWVEANRRLASPFSSLSFALVALASMLTGAFSRHANYLRPTIAILSVVGVMALQLAALNLAGRNAALMPLIWLTTVGPALAAGFVLFAPQPGRTQGTLAAGGRRTAPDGARPRW